MSLALVGALAFSFAALVFQGIAIGLPTWAIGFRNTDLSSLGLFGTFDSRGGYSTWADILARCGNNCSPTVR